MLWLKQFYLISIVTVLLSFIYTGILLVPQKRAFNPDLLNKLKFSIRRAIDKSELIQETIKKVEPEIGLKVREGVMPQTFNYPQIFYSGDASFKAEILSQIKSFTILKKIEFSKNKNFYLSLKEANSAQIMEELDNNKILSIILVQSDQNRAVFQDKMNLAVYYTPKPSSIQSKLARQQCLNTFKPSIFPSEESFSALVQL